jgi:hypothetical protein
MSRRARLWRWLGAHWRSVALLLLAAPGLLTLGTISRDPRSANILILAGCAALFTGLLGATAKFSFLGFRWQPLVTKRDGLKASLSVDLTRSCLQFAKLVASPDQVKELIDHAVHQMVIHCDHLPTQSEKYGFGLCTITRLIWSLPAVAQQQLVIRSSANILGGSVTKALFTLDARSRLLYVLAAGGYASVDEIAGWLEVPPADLRVRLAHIWDAFDRAASA